MLFSIITVTFNDAISLSQTKNSVLSQNYKDYEWIIVDGKSTDNTSEILSEIEIDRVCIISEKDAGLYDAMNKGIFSANGEYLIFLNSGDIFDNNNLLSKVAKSINNNPHLIYGDSKEISEQNKIFYKKSRPLWWSEIGMFTHHQSIFYNRKLILDKNIKYNLKYTIAADYDFTLNVIRYSDRCLYLPFSFCIFQQGGISHKNWKDGLSQQNEIRKNRLNMPFYKIIIIYIMQYFLHIIRFNITWAYNIFRFKN